MAELGAPESPVQVHTMTLSLLVPTATRAHTRHHVQLQAGPLGFLSAHLCACMYTGSGIVVYTGIVCGYGKVGISST